MAKIFKAKPREILAVQFTGDNGKEIADWLDDSTVTVLADVDGAAFRIDITYAGSFWSAMLMDWIIMDPNNMAIGMLRPEDFQELYEEVE